MSLNHNFQLIQPLIHFPPYQDENPISYLIRLKNANICNTISWLIYSVQGRNFPVTYIRAFNLLRSTVWLNYQYYSIVEEVSNLPSIYLNKKAIRVCPLCLEEANYYRANWMISASLVCLKHETYLQDTCMKCEEKIHLKSAVGICSCGERFSSQYAEKASLWAISLQLFLEGKPTLFSEALCGINVTCLSILERVKFIVTLSEWDLESVIYKDKNKRKRSISLESLDHIAGVFFAKEQDFHDYLSELSELRIINLPKAVDNIFVVFYRCFYRRFHPEVFIIYKQWIEKFIFQKWNKPISHRNSFFSEQLVENHPWITIGKACKNTKLVPSHLYRAIEDGYLLSVNYKKSQNLYTLVYRPNLYAIQDYLSEITSFSKAKVLLGITKKQLYELLENGFFSEAISPQKNKQNAWVIPRKALLSLIDRFHQVKIKSDSVGITIGEAMRIICGRIPLAFVSLVKAILSRKVVIYYLPRQEGRRKDSLQDFAIYRPSLDEWISEKVNRVGYFTVPELALYWDIHQEFAYQLVNMRKLTVKRTVHN